MQELSEAIDEMGQSSARHGVVCRGDAGMHICSNPVGGRRRFGPSGGQPVERRGRVGR